MKHTEIKNFFKGNINIPLYDPLTADKAKYRQDQLTKPIGSLGKLEALAIWMAGWQKKLMPTINNPCCLVFAGNHGISSKGVSAILQK